RRTPRPPAPGPAPAPAPVRRAPTPIPAAAHGNGGAHLEDRRLSPAVRKIMREHGVGADELSRIAGSGLAGRVTRDDLLDYLAHRGAPAAATATATAPAPAPAAREGGPPPGVLRAAIEPAARRP